MRIFIGTEEYSTVAIGDVIITTEEVKNPSDSSET